MHLTCLRVAGDVGERLLHDAVGGRFHLGSARPPFQTGVLEVHTDPRVCRVALELPEQRRQQSQVVQDGGPEVQRQFTHVSDQLSNHVLGLP
jgi:hypothetical protein